MDYYIDRLERLIEDVGSSEADDAQAAESAFAHLPANEIEPLLRIRNREAGWAAANPYGIRTGCVWMCVIVLILATGVLSDELGRDAGWISFAIAIPLTAFYHLALVRGLRNRTVGRRVRALRRLQSIDRALSLIRNKHCIETLLPFLERGERYSFPAAIALTGILPTLVQGEGHYLPRDQRRIVYKLLAVADPQRYEGLILAILHALGEVGGSGAIVPLEYPAFHPAKTPAGQRIKLAAQTALKRLHSRLAREEEGKVLLRPAVSPERPEETLLRPAQAGTETDPQQLLRPVADD